MSRFDFFRPCFAPSCARCRVAKKGGLALLLAALCAAGIGQGARADEFSPVPTGDPIYRQLSALDPTQAPAANKELTRYEAALQVARVITRVSNEAQPTLSRVGWRALRDLSGALKSELSQLGIDVAAAQNLADRQLKSPLASPDALNSVDLTPAITLPPRIKSGAAGQGLLGGTPLASPAIGLTERSLSASILPRLRVGAARLALERAQDDPFNDAGSVQALLSADKNGPRVLGNQTSLGYDVFSWLSFSASASRRVLANNPDISPFLRDSFFRGAGEARSTSGGVAIDVGALNFSTNIETLSTDTGARGTSLGGGIGLSAWQNRLSLMAHLARLQPEDRAILPSTRAEVGVGLDVTRRVRLNLFYQGLFSDQTADSSGRLTGGLNLSF